LLFIGVLTSCSEEGGNERIPPNEDPGGAPNDSALSLEAHVEGIALNADMFTTSRITIEEKAIVRITAENSLTDEVLQIQFPEDIVSGTYNFSNTPTIGDFVFGRFLNPTTSNEQEFISESGLLNIQLVDGKISGNTVFTLANSNGGVIEVTFCEFSL